MHDTYYVHISQFSSILNVVIAGSGNGNGNEVLDCEWKCDGNGNDCMGMGENGNKNRHSHTRLVLTGPPIGPTLGRNPRQLKSSHRI